MELNFILSQKTDNLTENSNDFKYNATYRIDSGMNGYTLIIKDNKLQFTSKKEGKEESFKIVSTNYNSFYIESKLFNKILGINDKNEVYLFDKNITSKENNLKNLSWNFIKLNKKEYLIQNNLSKKFIEIKKNITNNISYYYPDCSEDINEITNNTLQINNNISKIFRFSFLKLYEEVQLKPEHIELIEKEPIDILIKYIDLSDKSLNRQGIKQTKKDEDNGELRYSVRSILENIPWIRKIFILMPNEKVQYFKPIEEIKDKFVYVKDKDFLGFDSANSNVFNYNLYKMSKFNLSENFILIDDDCFFGKPIKKTQFFYYDEEQKKVLPSIVNDDFSELIKDDVIKEYNKLFRRKYFIRMHSHYGWRLSQLQVFRLFFEQIKLPIINAQFTHNALPLNINDMKEINEFILKKYQYLDKTINSTYRTPYDLQPQTLFTLYLLNVKKRKVNSIPWAYYDIGDINNKNFDIELFVINTSGNRLYRKSEYENEKRILISKFNKETPYELYSEENKNKNEDIKKNNESNQQKTNDDFNKQNFEKKILVEQIKENKDNIEELKMLYNDMEKKYYDLLFYFIIILVILLIIIFLFILKLIFNIFKNNICQIFSKLFDIEISKSNELNVKEESIQFNNNNL